MDFQTLEIGKHILAGFLTNLNIEQLHLSTPTTSSSTQSRILQQQRIMSIISQQDIVTNLKNCLEAYNYQNNLIGSQVSVYMKVYNSSMNFTLYIATIKWKYM